ncbi:guanine nucleotide-binding protein G(f) subunit alpha-like [Neocloeon triangulifer]|uniref:guanine nucleotide-binding protein G(f) subunit alpha-like n=1 Tax=Neocloeon triangulifer TaxID=2078957 RepID=UPI00286F0316|nr:guanine nucleotide-binding protein G(f) subunit alpha-like [Neocloeon triangulifer]
MGLDCLTPKDEKRATARRTSRELDKQLAGWSKPFQNAIKILLLGAGEAGKTTIIKQMKILHISGFSDKERLEQVKIVRKNIHEAISCLCKNVSFANDHTDDTRLKAAVEYVLKANFPFEKEYYDKVEFLWKNPIVQEHFKNSNVYQTLDSAKYFLDKISAIRHSNYLPNDQDILRCRKKTTGIQKVEFTAKIPKKYGGGSQTFWMFDVGGQRGERRKWIQAFDGIHAVLFLVATSSFDQTLREDNATNRLREALTLFKDVWDSRYLRDAGVILFLNKQDVLEQKIKNGQRLEKHLPNFLPFDEKLETLDEYTDRAREYIRDLFLEATREKRPSTLDRKVTIGPSIIYTPQLRDEPRECYWHYTTAVDTRNIRNVFNDVHSMVISWNLMQLGLQ